VVETGGLENRLALAGYGGSNPSPSAIAFSPFLVRTRSSKVRGLLGAFRKRHSQTVVAETAFQFLLRVGSDIFSEHGNKRTLA
jgi:hypothetical protein